MADIETQFTEAMFDIYCRAKAEAKYNATIFLQMITGDGGRATAKTLINAAKPSMGIPSCISESGPISQWRRWW